MYDSTAENSFIFCFQTDLSRAWMPRDMQSCSQSTVCPKCKHQFACCDRRSFSLTGGGIVGQQAPIFPNPCLSPQTPEVSMRLTVCRIQDSDVSNLFVVRRFHRAYRSRLVFPPNRPCSFCPPPTPPVKRPSCNTYEISFGLFTNQAGTTRAPLLRSLTTC